GMAWLPDDLAPGFLGGRGGYWHGLSDSRPEGAALVVQFRERRPGRLLDCRATELHDDRRSLTPGDRDEGRLGDLECPDLGVDGVRDAMPDRTDHAVGQEHAQERADERGADIVTDL